MKILKTIYTIYALLLFWIFMIIFAPFIFIPLLLSSKWGYVTFFFIRCWAKVWSFSIGVKFNIHGLEHIEEGKPYIYIFNHTSYLDAPAIPMAVPQEIRALGKKELSKIPLFGFMISKIAVWVDRQSPESRKESIIRLRKVLHSGVSVVVAPEGTRNPSDSLMPFQNGAFRLSVETGVPIMPMAIIGAGKLMGRDSLLMSPGTIDVYFSKPIVPIGNHEGEIAHLKEKSYNRLEAMILTHE
ncbi:1-acyl-sn-glycerol-3-phosphate acyltransferase [Litoribacter alkaliphilus]|uniref:1-acyl-sn-glycerol-3-phosphate acyltransferase n=1 Tax=Litoribacter ruber TaxID=702568 RepID=A0AAP2G1X6_9BACT|nr:lysophospholipid acyltransferase family protein [Litoribacter alkaliphilus]MBS9524887.1 1-acyl-sn-glycerol-3-phosphate acyltransferase [Litoribacter alkaliphilus]